MAKLILVFCIIFVAMSIATACTFPGFICENDSDCCISKWFRCHETVKRCVKRKIVDVSTTTDHPIMTSTTSSPTTQTANTTTTPATISTTTTTPNPTTNRPTSAPKLYN